MCLTHSEPVRSAFIATNELLEDPPRSGAEVSGSPPLLGFRLGLSGFAALPCGTVLPDGAAVPSQPSCGSEVTPSSIPEVTSRCRGRVSCTESVHVLSPADADSFVTGCDSPFWPHWSICSSEPLLWPLSV